VPAPLPYDEAFEDDGRPRPHYAELLGALADPGELAARAKKRLRSRGVSFGAAPDGLFALDPLPRLLTARGTLRDLLPVEPPRDDLSLAYGELGLALRDASRVAEPRVVLLVASALWTWSTSAPPRTASAAPARAADRALPARHRGRGECARHGPGGRQAGARLRRRPRALLPGRGAAAAVGAVPPRRRARRPVRPGGQAVAQGGAAKDAWVLR
jgi:hypothetical protein